MKARTDEMNNEEFLTYLLRTRWKDRAWQAGAGLLTGASIGYILSLPLFACLLAVAAGICALLAASHLHFTEPRFVPTVTSPDDEDDQDIYPLNPDAMTDEELEREIFLSRGGRH